MGTHSFSRVPTTTTSPKMMSRLAMALLLCAMMAVCFAQEQTEKAANTENAAGGELEGRGYFGGYGGYGGYEDTAATTDVPSTAVTADMATVMAMVVNRLKP